MQSLTAVYRGWWVLAGLFLIYAASNGILMHTLPLTYPELIDEFGWDESQVTLPATILFIVAALTSPPIGILLDSYSPKKVILAGGVAMVIGLLAFSRVSTLPQMVAVYVIFALALSACGIVSTMLVLTRWFDRLRGRAMGILLLASSLGASVFPLILGSTMHTLGWRGALTIFAAIAAAMAILPAIFLLRDRPDGNESDLELSHTKLSQGPTLVQAIRQPKFYLIAFATGSIWLIVISLLQHQSIYLARDLGVSRDILPRIFSVFFAFSVAGKLSFGWLGDRLDKGITLIASLAVLATSLLILRGVDSANIALVFVYAAIAGVGFSGAFTTIQLWIASFYAGQSYGKILASLTLFDTLSGALGTYLAGVFSKMYGSYVPVIDMMIVVCVAAALCIYAVRRMQLQEFSNRTATL